MSQATAPTTRYEFLDWLRVIAIFVLLFYHTGMLFVGWEFHLQNDETIEALQRPMEMSHRLRMPLLFVIAGAGLWFASRRRSAGAVMKERTLRLLVPIVFGMLVIVPPQIYVERLARGQWSGDYMSFFFERVLAFQPYPQGDFSWHHLWFIVYLFCYVPLLLPLIAWLKGRVTPAPGVWLYALAVPLVVNEAVLKPLFPATHALLNDWYVFGHYLLLTAYGIVLASLPGAWDWLARQRHRTLGVSAVAAVAFLLLIEKGGVFRGTIVEATLANVFTWCSLLTLLAYGRQLLSFDHPVLRWARDASYPIYILHQTVMMLIAYRVLAWQADPWTKFAVVVCGTALGSAALYEVARRVNVLRFLLGMKPSGSRYGRERARR